MNFAECSKARHPIGNKATKKEINIYRINNNFSIENKINKQKVVRFTNM